MLKDIIFVIVILIVPLISLVGYAVGEYYRNKLIRIFASALSIFTNIMLILLALGMYSAIGKTQMFYQSFFYAIKDELKSNGDLKTSYSFGTNVIKAIDYYFENKNLTGDGTKSAVLSTEYLKNRQKNDT